MEDFLGDGIGSFAFRRRMEMKAILNDDVDQMLIVGWMRGSISREGKPWLGVLDIWCMSRIDVHIIIIR